MEWEILLSPPVKPPIIVLGGMGMYGERRWRRNYLRYEDITTNFPNITQELVRRGLDTEDINTSIRITNRPEEDHYNRSEDLFKNLNEYGLHQGVDIIPSNWKNNKRNDVFACFWGEIVDIRDNDGTKDVTLWCFPKEAGIIIRYLHIQTQVDEIYVESNRTYIPENEEYRINFNSVKERTVYSGIKVGDKVVPGQVIGFIGPNKNWENGDQREPHLHFEIRFQKENNLIYGDGANDVPMSSLAIDPTPLLYKFDRWPKSPKDNYDIWHFNGYARIKGLFLVPWVVERDFGGNGRIWKTHRFLEIVFTTEDLDVTYPSHLSHLRSNSFYLPIEIATKSEKMMIELLQKAFFEKVKVKLTGRFSYFFGENFFSKNGPESLRSNEKENRIPRPVIEEVKIKY